MLEWPRGLCLSARFLDRVVNPELPRPAPKGQEYPENDEAQRPRRGEWRRRVASLVWMSARDSRREAVQVREAGRKRQTRGRRRSAGRRRGSGPIPWEGGRANGTGRVGRMGVSS
jgi:hypothetical protein